MLKNQFILGVNMRLKLNLSFYCSTLQIVLKIYRTKPHRSRSGDAVIDLIVTSEALVEISHLLSRYLFFQFSKLIVVKLVCIN